MYSTYSIKEKLELLSLFMFFALIFLFILYTYNLVFLPFFFFFRLPEGNENLLLPIPIEFLKISPLKNLRNKDEENTGYKQFVCRSESRKSQSIIYFVCVFFF